MTARARSRGWVLTAVAAIAACGGGAEEVPAPASLASSRSAQAGAVAPTAAAALKVNGARRAEVSAGVPLVVAVVLRQSGSAPARVPSDAPPAPIVVGADGVPTGAVLRYLGADSATLAPAGSLTLRWEVQTPLGPDDYTVEWDPQGSFSIAAPIPRVRPARLRVLDVPADTAELFFAELALLQAEDNSAEILVRVDGLLADDPGNLLALRVRAESLEQLGEPEQARAAWMDLLARLRARAEAEEPGSEPEITFWINARLGELSLPPRLPVE